MVGRRRKGAIMALLAMLLGSIGIFAILIDRPANPDRRRTKLS